MIVVNLPLDYDEKKGTFFLVILISSYFPIPLSITSSFPLENIYINMYARTLMNSLYIKLPIFGFRQVNVKSLFPTLFSR